MMQKTIEESFITYIYKCLFQKFILSLFLLIFRKITKLLYARDFTKFDIFWYGLYWINYKKYLCLIGIKLMYNLHTKF